ncbi:hypothetical protein CVU37_00110 [candidate division BRC1 bacterium HGW-BRC1-1]|nr:MAG: hypothetical protein CVU37_00110 [candidate division BRC1 bacterium HGW-BRC1-1]
MEAGLFKKRGFFLSRARLFLLVLRGSPDYFQMLPLFRVKTIEHYLYRVGGLSGFLIACHLFYDQRSNMKFRIRMIRIAVFAIVLALASEGWSQTTATVGLLADMEQMTALGENVPQELTERITSRISENTTAAMEQLLPYVQNKQLPEEARAGYMWALGLTGSPDAIEVILAEAQGLKSGPLRHHARRALAYIGGPQAGEFLMKELARETEPMKRFSILNLLAQMKYPPALEKSGEILHVDPSQYFWQPVFVFGQFGDMAVPFLLKQLDDEDVNARRNAIALLGTWLLAPEAAEAFRRRYHEEKVALLRGLLLSGLEKVSADFDQTQVFFLEATRGEQDEAVLKFAKETLASLPKLRQMAEERGRRETANHGAWEREYAKLWESYGKEGDFSILDQQSRVSDEARLKALRGRMLARQSDEAFLDVEKINQTIFWNRMAAKRQGD